MKSYPFFPMRNDLVVTGSVPNDPYQHVRSHLYGIAGRITNSTYRCFQVHGWWWPKESLTEAKEPDNRAKCSCGKPVDTLTGNLFTGDPFDYLLCDDCYERQADQEAN